MFEATPYPEVTVSEGGGRVTGEPTKTGRTIRVTPKNPREYREFEVVTGWDSDTHYGESLDYPTYTTFYEDIETGILVTDKDAFEKWITR